MIIRHSCTSNLIGNFDFGYWDRYGKSGNATLDKFIHESKLLWIPYDQFKDVEYCDKGGFSKVYKAIWLPGNDYNEVVLKCHVNLNENFDEFLNEVSYHEMCSDTMKIIKLHGFTKDPNTLDYMVVMDYANKDEVYIGDLGLCRPVTSLLKEHDIYGVIPFIAPEVLRGNPYTQASDIYSFSMIMWEFTSGVQPFINRDHDLELSVSIGKGERPEIIENTPQCYVDLMEKCWNEDPLKRPSAKEISQIISKWIFRECSSQIISEELRNNIVELINAPIGNNNLAVKPHSQAYYSSRILDLLVKM
ncbi:hypothetical protein RclHR1_19030001 [Rhizophagus clarus]|uniref:Protein kinase domain-containing protein n=1 Tax=Rhizophagus clarus TaxID=94130 RepID=A0A2Z6QQD8_9GLOM|nr:hypothetical protein RclHR1_19030001 [Rhizophagus clarus]